MKLKQRIGKIPDGSTPLVGQAVAVRKISDGTTITTLTTDEDGFVTLTADGHYEPYYLHLANVPGGDKFWRSDEAHTVSVVCPKELPVALRLLGDGVIRGYVGEFVVALSGGGPSFTIADGAAVVAGHPFVQYSMGALFSISRPVTSTRIDRIIIRLYPEGSGTTPGKADIAVLAGVEGSAATALTQTTTVYELGLYTLTVPTAGSVTLTDERVFANETPPVPGITRSDAQTTTNASGEILTALNTSIVLPRTATYDVEAWVSCIHDNAVGWVLQATYGSLGSGTSPIQFSSPAQVAKDSSSKTDVADTGNSRLVRLNTDGTYDTSITSLPSITGVCVDASDNVYVAYVNGGIAAVRKYNSSLVAQWTRGIAGATFKHIATDGTTVYVADSGNNRIQLINAATGATGTTWGSAGSGDGKFNTPWGIAVDSGGFVWVVDSGNSRVQIFSSAGVYQTQFAIPASSRGCAFNPSYSRLWLAAYGSNQLQSYNSTTHVLVDALSQSTPDGIAVGTGDIVWASNAGSHNIAKWDEAPAGYGGLAVEIDGNLGSYITLGDLTAMLQNSHTRTATGPATINIKVYGKATSGTATFRSVVLSARAVPRA